MVSTAIRLPYTRPVLPRASSATSGLRFWGMMLEPVANSSGSPMNPNSSLAQSTTSSASRETCIIVIAAADWNSATKSRSATAATLFSASRGQPARRLADLLPQPRLDVQVDVLQLPAERELLAFDLLPDLF